jgi:hypothetical protein
VLSLPTEIIAAAIVDSVKDPEPEPEPSQPDAASELPHDFEPSDADREIPSSSDAEAPAPEELPVEDPGPPPEEVAAEEPPTAGPAPEEPPAEDPGPPPGEAVAEEPPAEEPAPPAEEAATDEASTEAEPGVPSDAAATTEESANEAEGAPAAEPPSDAGTVAAEGEPAPPSEESAAGESGAEAGGPPVDTEHAEAPASEDAAGEPATLLSVIPDIMKETITGEPEAEGGEETREIPADGDAPAPETLPDVVQEVIVAAEANAADEPPPIDDILKEAIVGTGEEEEQPRGEGDSESPIFKDTQLDGEGRVSEGTQPADAAESPIFNKTQVDDEGVSTESRPDADSVVGSSTDGEPVPSIPVLPPTEPPTEPLSPRGQELDAILTKMIKKHVLPDAEVRVDVINFARKKSAKLMLAQEYDEAAEIDMAIDIMFMSIEQDLRDQNSQYQTRLLQDRLAECTAMEQKVSEEWDQIIDNVRQRTAFKLEKLKQCHQEQLDQLESEWSAPEAKIPYSKPSPELLQIRQKQKAYALLHDFPNAKAMKLMAEAHERSEAVEGAKRFTVAVRIAHAQLLERQQREVECLVQNADSVVSLYQIDKERWLSSVGRTRKSLELRITSPKIMKRPKVQLPILASRPSSVSSTTTTSSVPTPGMITTRTRDQLAVYRKSPERRRLDLKPAEVHTIIRPSPRKPSRSETVEQTGPLEPLEPLDPVEQ